MDADAFTKLPKIDSRELKTEARQEAYEKIGYGAHSRRDFPARGKSSSKCNNAEHLAKKHQNVLFFQ